MEKTIYDAIIYKEHDRYWFKIGLKKNVVIQGLAGHKLKSGTNSARSSINTIARMLNIKINIRVIG